MSLSVVNFRFYEPLVIREYRGIGLPRRLCMYRIVGNIVLVSIWLLLEIGVE